MGASLLVLANKTDIEDSMSNEEIRSVRVLEYRTRSAAPRRLTRVVAACPGCNQNTQVDHR